MSELSYRYRAHPLARAQTFRLGESELSISDGVRQWSVPYVDFTFIEAFDARYLGSSKPYWRHMLHTTRGPIVLGAGFRDRWRIVDQRAEYQAFIGRLLETIDAINPDREYIHGRLLLNRAGGLGGKLAVQMLRLVRHTNPDRWANVAAWVMRRIGPRLRGHRRALEQLALAFPDKTPEEHQQIAVGMWDNLARTVVEYARVESYWPQQTDTGEPPPSRVVVDAASGQVLADIKAAKRRTMHFSMHCANWELCAFTAPLGNIKRLIPYRRLKNQALTAELVRIRTAAGTTPLAAGPLMMSQIKKEFGEGDALGMLIDQYYVQGIEVTFFGRPTKLNPFFARLVRIYECPVYGSRVIRRSDGRFDFEIVGPIEPPRDQRGRVDVQATMQQYASLLERWIREHPDQWLWLHRTWR